MPDKKQLQALAFWMDSNWVPDYVLDIPGTPCEQVIDQCCLIHFPDRLLDLFPNDADLQQSGMVSYLGMPLLDVDGKILGHLAVVDRRPMPTSRVCWPYSKSSQHAPRPSFNVCDAKQDCADGLAHGNLHSV